MQIVADENIPFVREAFDTLGAVHMCSGRDLSKADLSHTNVLLVRSVTPVDAALLDGTGVQFVGSATIGTDHVDLDYLRERGIAFVHAPGSNADSVVEYVLAALLLLAVRRSISLRGKRIGVIGCGNIGGRLVRRLPALGLHVLPCDPPLAARAEAAGQAHPYRPLPEVLAAADIVTLHVPLITTGAYPTHHLIDAAALRRMKPSAWLLNTSRGPVIDSAALRAARTEGHLGAVVLDVWEGEPTPDPELLRRVEVASPHIAGYSYDGKVQGTVMLYRALLAHFGLAPAWDAQDAFVPGPDDHLDLSVPPATLDEPSWLHALVQQMYDLAADDARMRGLLERPADEHGASFTTLRKHYPRRRAFDLHCLPEHAVPEPLRQAVVDGLRVSVVGEGT